MLTRTTSSKAAQRHQQQQQQQRQVAYALQALQVYNPDFSLTPEVLEIMRAFFMDLQPDEHGTITLSALTNEIARLDPHHDTKRYMRHDSIRHDTERLTFTAFCDWVMHWKAQHPQAVQNVYTSWAKQIAALDFGMSEGDSLFLDLKPEDEPSNEILWMKIIQLLQKRQIRKIKERVDEKYDNYDTSCKDKDYDSSFSITDDGMSSDKTFQLDAVKLGHVDGANTVEKKGSMQTVSKSFLAGGIAGIVAKSTLAPLDRIKILFQVNDKRKFSFRNAARMAQNIYVHDGFHALFRGNMLNILRVIPYAGLQHSGFDFFRHKFHVYNVQHAKKGGNHEVPKLSNLQLVTAGSLAGGVSLVLAYPLDIVRARYMVQMGSHRYTSIYDAVLTMYKLDGMRSFSRGLVPSLLGTLPYTGIGFSLNERFKIWTLEFQRRRLEQKGGESASEPRLNAMTKFVCSYFAACIAQTSTYPLDTIRRRIQTDGYVEGYQTKLRYTGVIATARIIVAREGWRGLFKGVSVNWMRSPVSTGISLTTYDILKEVMGVEKIE